MSASLETQRSMYEAESGIAVMSGVQAVVRIVVAQVERDARSGLRTAGFVSGYPGSPVGGLDQEFQRHLPLLDRLGIKHLPGHNEELAATAVWGSQLAARADEPLHDGVVGMWYAKCPGLDRGADAIRHAQFVGTSRHGGVLAVVGDDPAAKSSSLPNSSIEQFRTLGVPVVAPSTVQEVLTLGAHGIAMSRLSGLWTGVSLVAAVADGVASVDVSDSGLTIAEPIVTFNRKPYEPSLTSMLSPPSTPRAEEEIAGPRTEMAREYGLLNHLNPVTVTSRNPWLGIVAVGTMHAELVSALDQLGITLDDLAEFGVSVLHVRMPYPMHPDSIMRFATGLQDLVVIEEKKGLVEDTIREVLYGRGTVPQLYGKRRPDGAPFLPAYGTLDADLLAPVLRERLLVRVAPERLREPATRRVELPVLSASRTPFYCAGCPHSTGTKAPAGAHVGAGIGCHGMAQSMDPQRVGIVDSTTHMGAEGAQWIGMSPFVRLEHMFQNMGDGTYFHSGQLAIQAAVAAGTHVTYKLLVNDAVAMTGGQNPAWSDAIPVPKIARVLLEQGVARVLVTTDDVKKYGRRAFPRSVQVWDRSRIIEAQEVLAATPGVTVLIHDQRCAAENRRDRKRGRIATPTKRVYINERVCEGCGDCGVKSACLAVEPVDTELGRKTQINQSLCNFDYSCIEGDCPSFLSVVVPEKQSAAAKTARKGVDSAGIGRVQAVPLRAPTPLFDQDRLTIRMPGIGGTGVVTTSHVLAVAAAQDGLKSTGLDQTGMSQKGGPVISDLILGREETAGSAKAREATVDVLLAFDMLGAAAPANTATLVRGHTLAVVSSTVTPTGAMVADVTANYPSTEEFLDRLRRELGDERVIVVDAAAITTALFGSAVAANTFLLGVAYQAGGIPISSEGLEEAIRFNGAAVEANLGAFQAGRAWVLDPAAFADTMPASHRAAAMRPSKFAGAGLDAEVLPVADRNYADLVDYMSEPYAQRYATVVLKAAAAERALQVASPDFTMAVAANLYKLMAYKDEYEVARLLTDPEAVRAVEERFGPGSRVYYNLHPPLFRAMGLDHKLSLGPWFTPMLKILRRSKRLRGTWLDPFGKASVRRTERALIEDYIDTVDELCQGLNADNREIAHDIGELPDMVRGYEHIKMRSVDNYCLRKNELIEQFRNATSQTTTSGSNTYSENS